jgi:hypothetical protein
VRRALLLPLLFASGCLEPGKPYLSYEDQAPPTLVSSRPTRGTTVDDLLKANEPVTLVFSEELDVRSLRPGISVRRGGQEVDIVVFAQGDGGVATNTYDFTGRDKPYSVGVKRANGLNWEVGTPSYIVRLNTLLIDTEGNAIEEQIDLRFQASVVTDGGI